MSDFWSAWDWSDFPFPIDPFNESDLGIAPNIPMSELSIDTILPRLPDFDDDEIIEGEIVTLELPERIKMSTLNDNNTDEIPEEYKSFYDALYSNPYNGPTFTITESSDGTVAKIMHDDTEEADE